MSGGQPPPTCPPVAGSLEFGPAKFCIGAGIGARGILGDAAEASPGAGCLLVGSRRRSSWGLGLAGTCGRVRKSPRKTYGAIFGRSYVRVAPSCAGGAATDGGTRPD